MESNQEVATTWLINTLLSTQKLCVVLAIYARINLRPNNIARGVSLLDKIAIFVCIGKFSYK